MVQGLTEVVPVSSSGHLALVPWLLGWEEAADRTLLAAGLHAGSAVGIAWVLRGELAALPRTAAGQRTTVRLALSAAPAAVAGALARDPVEARLGRPRQIAALLAGAGVLLWLADRRAEDWPAEHWPAEHWPAEHRPAKHRPAEDGRVGDRPAVGLGVAVLAGVAQISALAPGVSRSAATLAALRWCRIPRQTAARESMLMSLPITGGAALLSLVRADRADLRAAAPQLAVGAPMAALAAGLAASRRPPASRAMTAVLAYRLCLAAVVVAVSRRRMPDSIR